MALTDYVIMPGADYQALVDKIKEKTGKTEPLKSGQLAAELDNITGGGSADVRYVTFMSHDGAKEEGKKAVATGDDCVDPFVKGIYPNAPAKESTAQYDFTWIGWSTEPNGPLDENALKNVTEDRVVYAVYASVLQSYTIIFYDDDGTTELDNRTWLYGETPSFIPEKEGLAFDGWEPAVTTVTGDATYTAKWSENITFAGATWADVVRIADAGNAQKYFALGDTKELSFIDPNGTSRTATVKIVGFDKDRLADGSGTAPLSLMTTATSFDLAMHSAYSYPGWGACDGRTALHEKVLATFPTALVDGIKTVKKATRIKTDGTDTTGLEYTDDRIWLPSLGETGFTYNYANVGVAGEEWTGYTGYSGATNNATYGTQYSSYATRSMSYNSNLICYRMNNTSRSYGTSGANSVHGIIFGFCI